MTQFTDSLNKQPNLDIPQAESAAPTYGDYSASDSDYAHRPSVSDRPGYNYVTLQAGKSYYLDVAPTPPTPGTKRPQMSLPRRSNSSKTTKAKS
jgi:hypothetical protein